MPLWSRIKNSDFSIRLRSWEYWPFSLVYAPVFAYWIWLSIKTRHFLFFSAANPGIDTGGLIGESKMDIYQLIPEGWYPKTILANSGDSLEVIAEQLQKKGIEYPFIAKPDVGERGLMVEKINNEDELNGYLSQFKIPIILQEFIDYSDEISVLHYRFPDSKKGNICSITLKEFLSITGDGKLTMEALILEKPRAKLQYESMRNRFPKRFHEVVPTGEKMILSEIGNHSRGTMFLNGNHLIDEKLIETFDKILDKIEGIYYARYDLKAASFEDLRAGKNFSILEINGVKSEPAHIYHPGYSLIQAYRDIFSNWSNIQKISVKNHELGVPYLRYSTAYEKLKSLRTYYKGFSEN